MCRGERKTNDLKTLYELNIHARGTVFGIDYFFTDRCHLQGVNTTHLESVQALLRDEAEPMHVDGVLNIVLALHPCETKTT